MSDPQLPWYERPPWFDPSTGKFSFLAYLVATAVGLIFLVAMVVLVALGPA
jgi:hypothetical protein